MAESTDLGAADRPTYEQLQEQVDRICSSPLFAEQNASQQVRLLRYLVAILIDPPKVGANEKDAFSPSSISDRLFRELRQ